MSYALPKTPGKSWIEERDAHPVKPGCYDVTFLKLIHTFYDEINDCGFLQHEFLGPMQIIVRDRI